MVYIDVPYFGITPFKLYEIALDSCCKGGGWNNSAWNTRSNYVKEQKNRRSSNRGFRLMLVEVTSNVSN